MREIWFATPVLVGSAFIIGFFLILIGYMQGFPVGVVTFFIGLIIVVLMVFSLPILFKKEVV